MALSADLSLSRSYFRDSWRGALAPVAMAAVFGRPYRRVVRRPAFMNLLFVFIRTVRLPGSVFFSIERAFS